MNAYLILPNNERVQLPCTADGMPIVPRVGDTVVTGPGNPFKVTDVQWHFIGRVDDHFVYVFVVAL